MVFGLRWWFGQLFWFPRMVQQLQMWKSPALKIGIIQESLYLVGCPTIRDWNRKLPQPANIWIAGTDLYFASIQPIGRTLKKTAKKNMLAFFLLEENHRCDTDHISIPLFSMVIALVSTEIVLHSCDIAAADMRSKREDRKLFFTPPFHVKLYKYISPVRY